MILKPGKPPHDAASYHPISLLPILSKLFEKLLVKRLLPVLEAKKVIPDHQFGFRVKHSTVEQIHRVGSTIRQALEKKRHCAAVFLDVKQAFDRVWHRGLLHKIGSHFSRQVVDIFESYLADPNINMGQKPFFHPALQLM